MTTHPRRLFLGLILLMALAGGVARADFCPVGQVWPGYDPTWVEPGVITGQGQTFYALIEPGDGCDCPLGFRVSTIDFFMTLPEETQYPVTLSVSMGLKEAVPDPQGAFDWLPGSAGCETPIREFGIPFHKSFVGFGIALECDCFEVGAPAFLYFTIHSQVNPAGGLYTTGSGTPDPGRFLTVVEDQWVDLVAQGTLTRGDLVVSGFASCCEPPVGEAVTDWGSLKALYR